MRCGQDNGFEVKGGGKECRKASRVSRFHDLKSLLFRCGRVGMKKNVLSGITLLVSLYIPHFTSGLMLLLFLMRDPVYIAMNFGIYKIYNPYIFLNSSYF